MNTNEEITPHSIEKLEVYEKYLKAYLPVMIRAPFEPIMVIDPFAGKGTDENGHDGSAVRAQKVLNSLEGAGKVHLIFNDSNPEYYQSLRKCLGTKDVRIKITNWDANVIINKCLDIPYKSAHRLFFIDPFGYTQLTPSTWQKLFLMKNTEILIFIPTYHVYRFLHAGEYQERLRPIAQFLSTFGIDSKTARYINDHDEFLTSIQNGLKDTAGTQFVYKKSIKHENCNSRYCLFFITKHIYGADRFLEALRGIDKNNPDLFYNTVDDRDTTLINAILAKKKWNNKEVYEEGIKLGFPVSKIVYVLGQLENEGKIAVNSLQKRRGTNYYIKHKYLKEEPRLEFITQTR